jgi:SAM-dependent methyltransferase
VFSVNPWLKVPYNDYVEHMSHAAVYQFQVLNAVFKKTLKSVQPSSVLVLGCGGGNGFEHIDPQVTSSVTGVDINGGYLEHCDVYFGNKGYNLELYASDMNREYVQYANSFDLVTCYLFLEYVDIGRVLNQILPSMKKSSVLNIVIQQNNKCQFVSDTGVRSLSELAGIAKEIRENELENALARRGFEIVEKDIVELPNGKAFVAYVCELGE